jgi:hypothetical protein
VIRHIVGFLRERIDRKKPKVPRAIVLAARPVRNPLIEWERESRENLSETVALLRIPRRKDRFGNIVAKLFRLPDFRKLELDEIGSDVWEMCDGGNSVEAVTKAISTKYRLNRRQAETSVTAYLRMLAERRLILLRSDRKAGEKSGSAASAKAAKAKTAKSTPNVQRRQKQA